MKVLSKEILAKKEMAKINIIGSPMLKNKGQSKSVSKSVKAFEI